MLRFVLVCVAGAVGTGARYLTMLWAERVLGPRFPWGTFLVNVSGSFLIALIAVLSAQAWVMSPTTRLTLMTGFLGGLTTYSTFNQDTYRFLESRAYGLAAAYVASTLLGCLLAGALGHAIGKRV